MGSQFTAHHSKHAIGTSARPRHVCPRHDHLKRVRLVSPRALATATIATSY